MANLASDAYSVKEVENDICKPFTAVAAPYPVERQEGTVELEATSWLRDPVTSDR